MRPLQNQMGLKKKETRYTIMFYYATEFSLYPQKHIFHNKTVLVAALTALVNCFVAVSLMTTVTHMFFITVWSQYCGFSQKYSDFHSCFKPWVWQIWTQTFNKKKMEGREKNEAKAVQLKGITPEEHLYLKAEYILKTQTMAK